MLRLIGLRKLPDVSAISRDLSQMETKGVENVRCLSRGIVIEALYAPEPLKTLEILILYETGYPVQRVA